MLGYNSQGIITQVWFNTPGSKGKTVKFKNLFVLMLSNC